MITSVRREVCCGRRSVGISRSERGAVSALASGLSVSCAACCHGAVSAASMGRDLTAVAVAPAGVGDAFGLLADLGAGTGVEALIAFFVDDCCAREFAGPAIRSSR